MSKNDHLINSICKTALHYPWDKKINKIFWRGSITGFEDLEKNERFKIVKLGSQYPDIFDVGLTNIKLNEKFFNFLKSFYYKNNIHPANQLAYKYLLAIDGNAFPGAFFWQLFSNSLIFKNKSDYLEWYYINLKNNEHYVEYCDEKDLLEKINFLRHDDRFAKSIIKNANEFSKSFLSNESILSYIFKLFEKYASLN